MFGKKKQTVSAVAGIPPAGAGATPPETKVKPKKEKPLSPRDIMASKIEQLSAKETLKYKLPEVYGGELAVVEMNPQYPQKGRKYMLGTERVLDGKPTGKIIHIWTTDQPRDIAKWIVERNGELFS